MNILQRLFSSATNKVVNLTGIQPWNIYESVIPQKELVEQYYGATARAIKIKSNGLAPHKPNLLKQNGKEVVPAVNTPLQKDLEHFNSKQSYLEARKLTHIYKSLTGIGAWLLLESRTPGYNVEFFVINPNQLYFNTVDEMGFPTSYRFVDNNGEEMIIPDEYIVIFREPDPESNMQGHSDVQASRYAHNSYEFAMNFNMNWFGNLARPEVVFSLPDAGEEIVKRFEAAFLSKFRGTKKAGKAAFLNHELKIHELTKTLQDMQFTEGIKLMREEVFSQHGVPKELALSSGTYQNVREAQRIFQLYTLLPELQLEADVYNEQLLPKYYGVNNSFAYANQKFKESNPVEADLKSNAEIVNLMSSAEQKKPWYIQKKRDTFVYGSSAYRRW